MFDLSPQSKLKLKRKFKRIKIGKIYANYDQIAKHHLSHEFLCLNLMSYERIETLV